MVSVDLSKISYYLIAVLSDGRQVHLENVAENIAWEENEKELAVRLNLAIRDIPFEGGRLSQALALCTIVYLFADWGAGQQEIFRGTVWEWEHSRIAGDSIVLTCYDLLFYLQKSTDSKYYAKGKTTQSIMSDILTSWNVPVGEYSGANVTHQKILYKGKTISAMLTETLDDAKKLGGAKSIIRANKGKADVVKQGGNPDIYAFTADTNLTASKDKFSMTNLVTRVVITGKDDSEGRPKVEATVDGKITRGFVPQRDVVFDDVELPDEEAKLVGSWQMEAGGEFWDNYLRLDADGKFYGSDCDGAQPYHGTWSVVQTPADSNLYWRGVIPTIVFRCVNGTVYRYGVEVFNDYEVAEGDYCRSMSFITCEGGTGYVSYGVYDEGGSVITDENGKLILKELDVTNELNWGEYWEEEGNG